MANDSKLYPPARDRSPFACAQREEHWRRVLARQRQSGLTATAFCGREKIKPSALSWWMRVLRERDQVRPKSEARKVRSRSRRPSFVPVHVIEAAPVTGASAVEVVIRSGQVIRVSAGFDPATLLRVVATLEGRPSFAEASEGKPC